MWLIVLINLSLLGGYLINSGNAKVVLVVFFIQSVLLGMETILKMLFCRPGDTEMIEVNGAEVKSTFGMNLFMACFFLVHYGVFILAFGMIALVSKNLPPMDPDRYSTLYPLLILIAVGMVIELPSKILAVRKKSPGLFTLMFVPYIRLIPLAVIVLGSEIHPSLIFPLFLFLKTIVDLVYYYYVDKPAYLLLKTN